MGPKRFYRQNFSLFLVKFKKLGFSAPLRSILKPNLFAIYFKKYKNLKNFAAQINVR